MQVKSNPVQVKLNPGQVKSNAVQVKLNPGHVISNPVQVKSNPVQVESNPVQVTSITVQVDKSDAKQAQKKRTQRKLSLHQKQAPKLGPPFPQRGKGWG